MRCAAPIWIQNEKTRFWYEVPCGRCYACAANRRSVWTFRMLQELRVSESAYFVTLTYAPECVPLVKEYGVWMTTLVKEDLQLFIKRLRKRISEDLYPGDRFLKKSEISGKWSPKLRYYASGEYGFRTERAHYHIVMYNLPIQYVKDDYIHNKKYSVVLEEVWSKGHVDIGDVEQASAHYTTKHNVIKSLEPWDDSSSRAPPFTTMSRKPGIGINYVNEENRDYFIRTKNSYTHLKNGFRQPIGRYYKEKFFPPSYSEIFDFTWEDEEGKIRKEERRLSIPNKIASEITRKAVAYGKKQDEAELFRYATKHAGEIDAALADIREVRRKQFAEAVKRIKRNLNKGKKL